MAEIFNRTLIETIDIQIIGEVCFVTNSFSDNYNVFRLIQQLNYWLDSLPIILTSKKNAFPWAGLPENGVLAFIKNP